MAGRTVLEKLGITKISATDIAGQFWCEKKVELGHMYGAKRTKYMERGSQLHEKWQSKVFVPLTVETRNSADWMYKTAYENYQTMRSLSEKHVGRELFLYGSINGYKITGKIDELRIANGKVVVVEDKTTKSDNLDNIYKKSHMIQIMLYRKLLQDLKESKYAYQNIAASYGIETARMSDEFQKGLVEIGIRDELRSLPAMFKQMFSSISAMPELDNNLILRYSDMTSGDVFGEITVSYEDSEFSKELIDVMGYWNGQREARPVPESERWKCTRCEFFGKQCTAWYGANNA